MSGDQSPIKLDEHELVENKLLLLYLIDRMEIPMNSSQISQFILEEELMNYFALQQCLSEMVSSGLLEKSESDDTTSYTLNDEGLNTLELFTKQIPPQLKAKINKYIAVTRETVKQDYEVTSIYFYDQDTGEYTVKCGVYDNETTLMEVNVSVVTRDQARLICGNWKKNVNKLYIDIIQLMINSAEKKENDKKYQ